MLVRKDNQIITCTAGKDNGQTKDFRAKMQRELYVDNDMTPKYNDREIVRR